jgi:spoIIIJ-associated protein
MESLEISAKTEEEAVEIALEKLGADREEVEVVVLKRGKTRFLGLGGEETTVRVTRRQSEETKQEAVTLAKDVLEKLLHLMKISAVVDEKEASSSEEEAPVALNITGDDLGILIGRRGQTLFSLQHIVYLIVSHQMQARVPIIIDVEGYRERRQEALTRLAIRIAESVAASGQPVDLEPMPANERRIIHLALQNHSVVTTESAGEGESRKVTIKKR